MFETMGTKSEGGNGAGAGSGDQRPGSQRGAVETGSLDRVAGWRDVTSEYADIREGGGAGGALAPTCVKPRTAWKNRRRPRRAGTWDTL